MIDVLKIFNDKKIFISYIGISLIIYFEIYLLSAFLATLFYNAISKRTTDISVILCRKYELLLLFLTVLIFIIKKSHLDFRKKTAGTFLLFHILFLSLFIYALSMTNNMSSRLLDTTSYILDLIQPLGMTFSDFAVKFGVLFIILFSCLHYTLLLSVFYNEKLYFKYLYSILATILWILLNRGFVITFLHKHLIHGVANVVYLFLKISGFNANILVPFDTPPTIGTDIFRVRIYEPCSGFEGISTFLVAFMILGLLKWKRMKTINALVVACIGSFVMYGVNIVRIYVLILIGHFYGSAIALDLWHSTGSAFLYAIAIIAILAVSYRWMLSSDPEKPASD